MELSTVQRREWVLFLTMPYNQATAKISFYLYNFTTLSQLLVMLATEYINKETNSYHQKHYINVLFYLLVWMEEMLCVHEICGRINVFSQLQSANGVLLIIIMLSTFMIQCVVNIVVYSMFVNGKVFIVILSSEPDSVYLSHLLIAVIYVSLWRVLLGVYLVESK